MNHETNTREMKKQLSPAQLRKREAKINNLVRRVIQIFFFFSMPGAFAAGFSGAKYICTRIGEGRPIEWNSFLLVLTALCVFTIVFGRFFCGYICAFGSLGDLVYRLSGLIQLKVFKRKKQIRIPEKFGIYLQIIKYLVQAAVLISCVLGIYNKYSSYDPWSVFSLISAFRFDISGSAGTLILAGIIVGMAFKERFFCQYLCPMGAIFSLLPVLPFSYYKRDWKNCIPGCKACKMSCPVDIQLEKDGFRNGECISCSRCRNICPKANLDRWDIRLFRNEAISSLIKAGIFLIVGILVGVFRFF